MSIIDDLDFDTPHRLPPGRKRRRGLARTPEQRAKAQKIANALHMRKYRATRTEEEKARDRMLAAARDKRRRSKR